MKKLILALTTTLLAAGTPQTGERPRIHYRDLSGRYSLTVSQEIEVPGAQGVIARRDFLLDLSLQADRPASTVTVTIDRARASYEAHGMKQRLGTSLVSGRSFVLSTGGDGRRLDRSEPSDGPVFGLDAMVGGGYPVAGLLTGVLPVLPEEAVAPGAAWVGERSVRTLEGWGWGTGRMTSRHRVTAVDERDGRTVVTVETRAEARLEPVEGERAYSGDLKRTARWSFDAAAGRLLSLSMEQETSGDCEMPMGKTQVRQVTRVELAPLP